MIVLTVQKQLQFPVTADCITPDNFQGKSIDEIAALPVWEGNKPRKIGDIFKIEQTAEETQGVIINGNAAEVRRVGSRMKTGEILINGNIGMHLGEKISGGKITVNGDAAQWAGSGMKDGLIEIRGNAGDYLASPYRGSTEGMKGGKIVVNGNVGADSACYLHGGLVRIRGNVTGQFLGFGMSNGTIYVEKSASTRLGTNMTGGKIVVGGFVEEVMPTFSIDSIKPKVKIDETESAQGPFYVFLGDLAEAGNGKVFVSKTANPHLSKYEKFL